MPTTTSTTTLPPPPPFPPGQFNALVPNPSTMPTVCEEMVKGVIRSREYAYQWVRWMLTNDGELSNGFRALRCATVCDGFDPTPAPVLPDQVAQLATEDFDDLCDTIEKLSKADAAYASIYGWMFNTAGDDFSDDFRRAICAIECPTTSTTTTESGGSTTTSTTSTTTTSTTTTGTTLPPWNTVETQRRWIDVAVDDSGTNMVAVVEYGQIYVSNDGGDNWTAKDLNRQYRACTISADGSKMYAIATTGEFLYSLDSGANWSAGANPTGGDELLAIDCSNTADYIYVCGRANGAGYGRVWRSTNDGASWAVMFQLAAGFRPLDISCNGSGSTVYAAYVTAPVPYSSFGSIKSTSFGAGFTGFAAGYHFYNCSSYKGVGGTVVFGSSYQVFLSDGTSIFPGATYYPYGVSDVAMARDGSITAIATGSLSGGVGPLVLNGANQDQARIWTAVSMDLTGCNNMAINFVSPGLAELRRHNC